MAIRTILDLPRNEAGLVNRFIGTAYDTVKTVADNLDSIKAVPSELAQIQGTESNISISFDDAKATIANQLAASQANLDEMTSLDSSGKINAAIAIDRAAKADASANSAAASSNSASQSQTSAANSANLAQQYMTTSNSYMNTTKGYRDELAADVSDIQNRYQSIIDANNNSTQAEANAKSSADSAALSASNAASSAQTAEQLTKSALEAAKTFQDIATGLANTTNGDFFNVIGSGNVAVNSYINDNGTAKYQTATPNYSFVQNINSNKVDKGKDIDLSGLGIINGNRRLNFQSDGSLSLSKDNFTFAFLREDIGLRLTSPTDNNSYLQLTQIDDSNTQLNSFKDGDSKTVFQYNHDQNVAWFNVPVNIMGNKVVTWGDSGSGNGFNADLLDGIESSGFVQTNSTSTMNTNLIMNNYALYTKSEGARLQLENNNHISFWNSNGQVAAWFDTDGANQSLRVNDLITANHFYNGSLDSYTDRTDIHYASRRTSFQTDGYTVWWGTDNTAKTSIKDGVLWTQGTITSNDMVTAGGLLHVTSTSGSNLNALDMHMDGDGIARFYAQNAISNGVKQLLIFDPDGDLNLYAPRWLLFNGHRVFTTENMGAGSGLNADLLDGFDSSYFGTQTDVTNLINLANQKIDGRYGVVTDGEYGKAGYYHPSGRWAFCSYQGDGSDRWTFLPTAAEFDTLHALVDTKLSYLNPVAEQQLRVNTPTNLWGLLSFSRDGNTKWCLQLDPCAAQDWHLTRQQDNGQQDFVLSASRTTGEVSVQFGLDVKGSRVLTTNDTGAGNGLDADLLRGKDPVNLCGDGDVQHGLNGWTRLPNDRVEMHFAGDWIQGGSGENIYTFSFPKTITQCDMVTVCTQVQLKEGDDISQARGAEMSYQIIDWTNSQVRVLKQVDRNDWAPTRPLFRVTGIN